MMIALVTIAGAWVYQAAGYAPCELCLKQRWAYYAALLLAPMTMLAVQQQIRPLASAGFALLALIFACNALLGIYHAGVEFHFWAGPSDCTGSYQSAPNMPDFLKQMQNAHVVRCDEVSLRVFGLSLAVWNIFISAALALIALPGWSKSVWPGTSARPPATKAT